MQACGSLEAARAKALKEGDHVESNRAHRPARSWLGKPARVSAFSKVFKTKAEAQAAGRKTAMRDGVEHLIQNRDGAVSEGNSYGNDSTRFKG